MKIIGKMTLYYVSIAGNLSNQPLLYSDQGWQYQMLGFKKFC